MRSRTVAEEPELRSDRYLPILLTKGFISKKVKIGPHRLIIKQVSAREIRRLAPFLGHRDTFAEKIIFMKAGVAALGLVMLDGYNLLPTRPDSLRKVVKALSSWSPALLDSLLAQVYDLTEMFSLAFKELSTYADSPESRYLWKTAGRQGLNSPSLTGWPGTENLVLNEAQTMWIFLQEVFDVWDRQEVEWQNLKWLVACQSKEGLKAMGQIETLRAERRAQFGSVVVEGKDFDKPHSADDLVTELHRSLEGKYDEHDYAVMDAEKEFLDGYLRQEEELREREREHLESQMPDVGSSTSLDSPEPMGTAPVGRQRRHLDVPSPWKAEPRED